MYGSIFNRSCGLLRKVVTLVAANGNSLCTSSIHFPHTEKTSRLLASTKLNSPTSCIQGWRGYWARVGGGRARGNLGVFNALLPSVRNGEGHVYASQFGVAVWLFRGGYVVRVSEDEYQGPAL